MDRRSFLHAGAGLSGAAALSVFGAQNSAAQNAAKTRRILFLDKAPRPKKQDALYDTAVIEKQLNSYASPGTTVELGFPDNYDGSLVGRALSEQKKLNGLDHLMATPALIRKIVWAQENGYDAVISSNTFDPGVEGGRLAVTIPVIGILRTAIHTALMLCDRVAITVPLPAHVPYTWRLLRTYGLENFVGAIKAIDVFGADIQSRKKELFDATAKLIRGFADETGAQMVVPLGGALIPYVVDPDDLAAATGMPVLNTKAVSIRFAETCIALGLTQSPAAYPHGNLTAKDFDDRT